MAQKTIIFDAWEIVRKKLSQEGDLPWHNPEKITNKTNPRKQKGKTIIPQDP